MKHCAVSVVATQYELSSRKLNWNLFTQKIFFWHFLLHFCCVLWWRFWQFLQRLFRWFSLFKQLFFCLTVLSFSPWWTNMLFRLFSRFLDKNQAWMPYQSLAAETQPNDKNSHSMFPLIKLTLGNLLLIRQAGVIFVS